MPPKIINLTTYNGDSSEKSNKKQVPQSYAKPMSEENDKDIEHIIVRAFPIEKIEPDFYRSLANHLESREKEIRAEKDHNHWNWYFIGFLSVIIIALLIILSK